MKHKKLTWFFLMLLCFAFAPTPKMHNYYSMDSPPSLNVPSLAEPDISVEWSYKADGEINYPISVGDVNNDGELEVFFGSTDRNMYCLTREGDFSWNFTVDLGLHVIDGVSTRAILSDVNSDGIQEVLFGSFDGHLYCLSGMTGSLLWRYNISGNIDRSTPAVAYDYNLEEKLVVFGGENGIYCIIGSNGSLLWQQEGVGSTGSSPTIVDVDDDSELEVIVGDGDDFVYSLSLSNGEEEWAELLVGLNSGVLSGPVVADVDGDKIQDVFVTNWAGYLYRLNGSTGSKIWTQFLDYIWSSPVVVDLNRDGNIEVVAVGGHGDSGSFSALNGSPIWTADVEPVYSSPAVADVDLDGNLEVVMGRRWNQDGIIALDSFNGETEWEFPINGSFFSSPIVLNLDSDREQEILIGSDQFVVCLEIESLNPNAYSWPSSGEEGGVGMSGDWTDSDNDGLKDDFELFVAINQTNHDSDADALDDGFEYLYSTNPTVKDTDADLMFDGWEVFYQLNPLVNDSYEDSDSDGLTNLEEFNLGTNPRLGDTDNDGLSDFMETELGTNPTLEDTDEDGFLDGFEVTNGWDPRNKLSPFIELLLIPISFVSIIIILILGFYFKKRH